MGYAAKLLSGSLQGFDLLAQLSLFGLLLSKYLIDILHDAASFMQCRLVPSGGQ